MPNQEEVEKFKITPEMRGFLKTYKKFNEVGIRLRGEMQIHLDNAAQTRQMLEQVEKGMQMLTLNAPEKPTFEVAGQDEPSESQAQGQEQQTMNPMINY
jgi:predicted ribonuclease toxin of YeeF-YezG toxin-antitoxin module